jgi:2-dehydro-3-deoxygluconokinase
MLLSVTAPEGIIDILRGKGVRYIAIKNGAEGAICANTLRSVNIAPEKCKPIDPIGAGDGFNAGFLSGILKGCGLDVAGRMGAIAGAMATETMGDIEGYPTAAEMEMRLGSCEKIYR